MMKEMKEAEEHVKHDADELRKVSSTACAVLSRFDKCRHNTYSAPSCTKTRIDSLFMQLQDEQKRKQEEHMKTVADHEEKARLEHVMSELD